MDQMVYLSKMVIFYGYVSHNQMVDGKIAEEMVTSLVFPWQVPARAKVGNQLSTPHSWIHLGVSMLQVPLDRWMVFVCFCYGKSQSKMDDESGYPHDFGNPHLAPMKRLWDGVGVPGWHPAISMEW